MYMIWIDIEDYNEKDHLEKENYKKLLLAYAVFVKHHIRLELGMNLSDFLPELNCLVQPISNRIPLSKLLYNLIDDSLQHTFNTNTLDTNSNTITNLHHEIKQLHSMTTHYIPDTPSIFSTLSGLIPDELVYTVSELLPKKTATTL
ncbi:33781_t:CDS:2, partial [Gigaspora margarita]